MRCDKNKRGVFDMFCYFCKGDSEESTTTFFSEVNDHIIIIKNVPCHKCTQCGDVYFNFTVTERLEQITEQLESSYIEVAIVSYSAA